MPPTFFLTGPARSGTTLLTRALNDLPDVVCLNEVFFDPLLLEQDLARTRDDILAGRPVPNRFDSQGNLAANSIGDATTQSRPVAKPLSPDFILGHKGGVFWLLNLDLVVGRMPVIAIVRDPVATIASWCSPAAIEKIPISQMAEQAHSPVGYRRWNGFSLHHHEPEASTPVERRASLWNCLALTLLGHSRQLHIVRYEDLVTHPEQTLTKLAELLGTPPPTAWPEIEHYDIEARYGAELVAECREAVQRFAPLREAFGYE